MQRARTFGIVLAVCFLFTPPVQARVYPERNREGTSRTKQGVEQVHDFVRGTQRVSVSYGIYPLPLSPKKRIEINLTQQRLKYFFGSDLVGSILISSGVKTTPTPTGVFYVQKKLPFVNYFGRNFNGTAYNYPRTKWNLMFLPRYYIHGAYWHNAFGAPRSRGCVNVSYKDMERLYTFTDPGTPVYIHY